MGIHVEVVIGAALSERLPCTTHSALIRRCVTFNIFSPPYYVLSGPDIDSVDTHPWRYSTPRTTFNHLSKLDFAIIYRGNDLEQSLAAFENVYDSNVCWEGERLELLALNLPVEKWLYKQEPFLPQPRITSRLTPSFKWVTPLDEHGELAPVEIGPFYDTLEMPWSNVMLGDPYRGKNHAILLDSPLGQLLAQYWGTVQGGDHIIL